MSVQAIQSAQPFSTEQVASPSEASLHSYLSVSYENEAKYHDYTSSFWKVLATVTVIAFVLFAVGGVLACALLGPTLLPFALITLAGLSTPLTLVYNALKKKAIEHELQWEMDKETCEICQELERLGDTALYVRLSLATPNWNKEGTTASLLSRNQTNFYRAYIPVLARHEYWKRSATKAKLKANELINEATRIREEVSASSSHMTSKQIRSSEKKIERLRETAYATIETIEAPSKMKAAFMLYVLENPLKEMVDSQGFREKDIGDFGKWMPLNIDERLLLNRHENRDPFFVKNDGSEVRKDWILDHSFQQIARAAFASA